MRREFGLQVAVVTSALILGWPATSPAQAAGDPAVGRTAQDAEPERPPAQPVPLPPVTEADRAAAFPDVQAHPLQDDAVHYFVQFDQLEWHAGNGSGLRWETDGWLGRDRDRLWFRSEGESADGRLGVAEAHLFYGRAVARWWELVVGVRQDFRPGPAETWFAFGVQGLAPYWFEIDASLYVSDAGRTAARLEVAYELLLTNRLIAQPLIEVDLHGKSDPERGVAAGVVSNLEAGLRIRYEFHREVAPYVGLTWSRAADPRDALADLAGHAEGLRLVTGLRLWF